MIANEATAERMFIALKNLSDLAQESYLAFQEVEQRDEILKECRKLVSNVLGRTFDPFQRILMEKFESLTMTRLRERIPLKVTTTVCALMESVVEQGDRVIAEFGEEMRAGESEGIFRKGSVEDFTAEIEHFRVFVVNLSNQKPI
jgi:hypothetical protein